MAPSSAFAARKLGWVLEALRPCSALALASCTSSSGKAGLRATSASRRTMLPACEARALADRLIPSLPALADRSPPMDWAASAICLEPSVAVPPVSRPASSLARPGASGASAPKPAPRKASTKSTRGMPLRGTTQTCSPLGRVCWVILGTVRGLSWPNGGSSLGSSTRPAWARPARTRPVATRPRRKAGRRVVMVGPSASGLGGRRSGGGGRGGQHGSWLAVDDGAVGFHQVGGGHALDVGRAHGLDPGRDLVHHLRVAPQRLQLGQAVGPPQVHLQVVVPTGQQGGFQVLELRVGDTVLHDAGDLLIHAGQQRIGRGVRLVEGEHGEQAGAVVFPDAGQAVQGVEVERQLAALDQALVKP
mmetsp:Transcript_26227/g.61967  ORF Transcript_26227/g.61967 Transcript_26227/m.61967 type:complete len:361 (-) Transcript_26227:1116-2198(-)